MAVSATDTAAIVAAIFEVPSIPRPLAATIFDKCRGHPRFITEISDLLLSEEKVLIKDGKVVVTKDIQHLALPNSIRAVFTARMDQLSSSEQITLKVASVIGPVFSLNLVCDVYPSGASKLQVADDMVSLLREGMVATLDQASTMTEGARTRTSKKTSLPSTLMEKKKHSIEEARKSAGALLNMSFVFSSEVLRELAYEQLTFSIRRALHKKIAEWYEYTYTTQLDHHAVHIADHWERGDRLHKALQCESSPAKVKSRCKRKRDSWRHHTHLCHRLLPCCVAL